MSVARGLRNTNLVKHVTGSKVVIPFIVIFCREDMEKVNVMFHDNGTVTYQHNKILKFVPELSTGDKYEKLTVPNIPLLVGSSLIAWNFVNLFCLLRL